MMRRRQTPTTQLAAPSYPLPSQPTEVSVAGNGDLYAKNVRFHFPRRRTDAVIAFLSTSSPTPCPSDRRRRRESFEPRRQQIHLMAIPHSDIEFARWHPQGRPKRRGRRGGHLAEWIYCQMVSDDCRSPHFPSVTTTSSTTHDHIFCNSRIFGIQTSTPAAEVSTSIAHSRFPSLPSLPVQLSHLTKVITGTLTLTHSAPRPLSRSCAEL